MQKKRFSGLKNEKKTAHLSVSGFNSCGKNYREFFKVGAGLNPTVLLALILISSPV